MNGPAYVRWTYTWFVSSKLPSGSGFWISQVLLFWTCPTSKHELHHTQIFHHAHRILNINEMREGEENLQRTHTNVSAFSTGLNKEQHQFSSKYIGSSNMRLEIFIVRSRVGENRAGSRAACSRPRSPDRRRVRVAPVNGLGRRDWTEVRSRGRWGQHGGRARCRRRGGEQGSGW